MNKSEFFVDFTAHSKVNKIIEGVPLFLQKEDKTHIFHFRLIIEMAWTQFRFNVGQIASVS